MEQTAIDIHTIVLECIDGKDDHLKIAIENAKTIVLSSGADGNSTAVKELETGGVVIFTNNNGQLTIDATDCALPVKINGQLITKSEFRLNDVLRIGNSIWKINMPGRPIDQLTAATNSIRQGFTRLIGLEELKDFKLKHIFSQVFKKHTLSQMEEQLLTGTSKNIPAITDIETSWAKPWLFSRLLAASIVITAILMLGFKALSNENLIPGTIFLGCFAVPLSTLIFYLEMNAPRNISIFIVMGLFFTGGIAALVLAMIMFSIFPFLSNWLAASAAGLIEEPSKVIIVILLLARFKQYRWVLNGLLFGAAIGAGFAAFESAGYAFKPFLIPFGNQVPEGLTFGGVVDQMNDSIMLRGILSPFMHIVWTGNAVAALWLVKGSSPFKIQMLGDIRFLRVMLSSMILHMVWNANFTTIPLPIFLDLKYPVLGVLAWIISFRLIQTGLSQLNEARRLEVQRLTEQ